jgi:hypothetical protein
VLGPGGSLADRSGVYLVDKRYFVTAKIIDLLLEEFVHEHGGDLHAGDGARMAAWTLLHDGPPPRTAAADRRTVRRPVPTADHGCPARTVRISPGEDAGPTSVDRAPN